MKRGLEPNASKNHPKRSRATATDLDDPSRPETRPPNEIAPIASSSTPRPAVVARATPSSAPTLASLVQPEAFQFAEERPHWDRMRHQVLDLPAHIPHCLPYIVDENVSMSPEEAQSAIQARGMWMNDSNHPEKVLLANHSLVHSIVYGESIVPSGAFQ